MPESNADRLIENARADGAALGVLLEQYRHYLRLLARVEIGRKLQGKVDASDVVQDVFLNAHRQFPVFRGTSEPQFIQWLREIMAGTLANLVRRYFGTQARDLRMEQGLLADLDQSAAGLAAVAVDPHTSPSAHAVDAEQSLLIAEAIAGLPDDYQSVIVLRHLEGLSFPEIAGRMGRSVDSVEKLWVRALAKLKRSFGEQP